MVKKMTCIAILISMSFFAGCSSPPAVVVQEEEKKEEVKITTEEKKAQPTEVEKKEDKKEQIEDPVSQQGPPEEKEKEETATEEKEELAEDEPEEEEKIEAPILELQIIEGPTFAQGEQIVYYRVNAKISGNPRPALTFSTDDSLGAWGNEIAQVNLSHGQSYTLTTVAENEAGKAVGTVTLEWPEGDKQPKAQIDYGTSQNFRIDVSLTDQMVRVYHGGDLIREMICSGGTAETPTPRGTFKTSQKIHYSWLPRFDVGAYYFVRFYGSYLFHSLPFDEEGNLIQEEAEKLGQPASHGCIRLKVEDARWLYEQLPLGIEVNIF